MEKNESVVLIVVVVLILLFLFGGFGYGMMGWSGGGYGMMSGFYSGFGFGWIFMFLIWALVIIALVLGIMWLIKQLQQPQQTRNGRRK